MYVFVPSKLIESKINYYYYLCVCASRMTESAKKSADQVQLWQHCQRRSTRNCFSFLVSLLSTLHFFCRCARDDEQQVLPQQNRINWSNWEMYSIMLRPTIWLVKLKFPFWKVDDVKANDRCCQFRDSHTHRTDPFIRFGMTNETKDNTNTLWTTRWIMRSQPKILFLVVRMN